MVDEQNIEKFLQLNYIPFHTGQCIKRIIMIWVLSFLMCYIGEDRVGWMSFFCLINISVTINFIVLIVKYQERRISRFLCDGITYWYSSVLLNLMSYRFMTFDRLDCAIQYSYFKQMILFVLLIVYNVILFLVMYKKLQSRQYNEKDNPINWSYPFGGAVLGIIFIRSVMTSIAQGTAILLVAICILCISFFINIGSLNILKVYFEIKK